MHLRTWTCVALAAAAALSACRATFRLSRYQTNQALYDATLREFERGKWANAIIGFEKLTNDLPARDTLLPRAYWYLAVSHSRQREHLLAAQSYTRLYESFSDDTLADDAALEAARSYRKLWRKPTLDPTYGETAVATFNTLLGLYGETSPHADVARQEILELEEMFAAKNYETGRYYYRRKAYDSAVIFLKTVLERWPHVQKARETMILLAETYKQIRYREDLAEICSKLRREFPGDRDGARVCDGVAVVADSVATSAKPPSAP